MRLRCTAKWRQALATLAPYQQRINDTIFASLSSQDFRELSRIMRGLVVDADRAAHLMEFIVRQERGPGTRLGL